MAPADRTAARAIFIVALLLRVLFCFVVYPRVAAQFGPGDHYDDIAHNLANGAGYVLAGTDAAAERLPLYPFLLAASFLPFGASAWPWQLAQAVAGAVTCALLYTTACRVASRAGALVTAGVCVIHPTLLLYTARPLTETLYVLLVVLFVSQIARPDWRARPVGILLGLQLLTKSTAFLQLLALAPALVRRRGLPLLRALGWTALVLTPWVAWSLATSGRSNLVSARGGITLYHGVYISRHVGWTTPTGDLNLDAEVALSGDLAARGLEPTADIRRRDVAAREVALSWIRDHPREALRLWVRNLVLTWYLGRSRLSMTVHFVLHAALLTIAIVGVRGLWHATPVARQLAIIAVLLIGAYTAVHAALQPAVRYILPAVPLAALLAAGAFGNAALRDDAHGVRDGGAAHCPSDTA